MLKPTTANPVSTLGTTAALEDYLIEYPAAVINRVGDGFVAFVPYDLFEFYHQVRYPMLREFVGDVVNQMVGRLPIRMFGPTGVDMVLRQQENKTIVHLISLTSGLPNNPSAGAIDEIPVVGPITIEVELAHKPASVVCAFDDEQANRRYDDGKLHVTLSQLHIHQAIVIENEVH